VPQTWGRRDEPVVRSAQPPSVCSPYARSTGREGVRDVLGTRTPPDLPPALIGGRYSAGRSWPETASAASSAPPLSRKEGPAPCRMRPGITSADAKECRRTGRPKAAHPSNRKKRRASRLRRSDGCRLMRGRRSDACSTRPGQASGRSAAGWTRARRACPSVRDRRSPRPSSWGRRVCPPEPQVQPGMR
jgi:hypothetical protein